MASIDDKEAPLSWWVIIIKLAKAGADRDAFNFTNNSINFLYVCLIAAAVFEQKKIASTRNSYADCHKTAVLLDGGWDFSAVKMGNGAVLFNL